MGRGIVLIFLLYPTTFLILDPLHFGEGLSQALSSKNSLALVKKIGAFFKFFCFDGLFGNLFLAEVIGCVLNGQFLKGFTQGAFLV